jgi:hypothetical protein
MISVNFIFIGALLSFIGGASYIWGTLKGTTKPNRVTWFLWAFATLISAAAQYKGGVGLSTLTVLVGGLTAALVFIFSFVNKNAYWKTTFVDYACGALALTGLALWYATRNQDYAIAFAIFADLLASLPTLHKAWTHPQTENRLSYFLWILSNTIGILCVQKRGFTGYAFPIYLVLINLALFLIVSRPMTKQGLRDKIA